MRYNLAALSAIILLSLGKSFAQSAYIPLGTSSMHMLDRFEIKSGRLADPLEFNTSTKAYRRSSIAEYVDSFDVSHTMLSKQDYFNLSYLQNDNFEWSNSENTRSNHPIIKGQIYKHKAALFDVTDKEFNLVVNPVFYGQVGYDTRLKDNVYINNRGLELRGSIKGVVGFYTQVSDEINHINSWVKDYYQKDTVIPGVGYLGTGNTSTFNYWLASGYVTFNASKYIDFQIGHGRNFLGNGYRTFYMSDFSRDHFFMRINTHFWKINYTNIWGMIYDYTPPTERVLPKRHYYATTHLSLNCTKHLNIGLFQTISYQRDSGYSNGGMELEYFNPIIFYKPIENGLNSPDKTILGLDAKYNFLNHLSAYGQFVISEFVFKEVVAGNGWWGNKQAWQVGLKYIDVFNIKNLDLQVEGNFARPYMYTSFDPKNAYVNYNQNMAHPMGANFRELVTVVRCQPAERLFIKATGIMSTYGNDSNGSNWGSDIRMSYNTRMQEYGNHIGQGVTTHLYEADLIATYMIKHNVFLDLQLIYRKTDSLLPQYVTETFLGNVAVRINIAERRWDF